MSKVNLFIILFIGFIDYLGIGLVYPIFAALLFDSNQTLISIDASEAYRGAALGILIALTPLMQFFCSPLLGAYSDRKGRKKALLLGISSGCFGYFLGVVGILYNSLTLLFLYRLFVGVSEATAAVGQAVIVDMSTEKNKARRFALLNSALGFGFTIGPFLGGVISDSSFVSWFGYETPLILAGLMSCINLMMIIWKLPETKVRFEKNEFNFFEGLAHIRKVFQWLNLRWLFVGGFALSFGLTFFNEFIPVLLRARFDFTVGEIGKYYALSGASYALSAGLLAGFVLKRFSPEKLVINSLIGVSVTMCAFSLVNDGVYVWCLQPPLMFCLALVYPTTTAMISNRVNADVQGEVLGVFHSIQASAMGLCPLFVGYAVGLIPELVAWGGSASIMCACLALYRVFYVRAAVNL